MGAPLLAPSFAIAGLTTGGTTEERLAIPTIVADPMHDAQESAAPPSSPVDKDALTEDFEAAKKRKDGEDSAPLTVSDKELLRDFQKAIQSEDVEQDPPSTLAKPGAAPTAVAPSMLPKPSDARNWIAPSAATPSAATPGAALPREPDPSEGTPIPASVAPEPVPSSEPVPAIDDQEAPPFEPVQEPDALESRMLPAEPLPPDPDESDTLVLDLKQAVEKKSRIQRLKEKLERDAKPWNQPLNTKSKPTKVRVNGKDVLLVGSGGVALTLPAGALPSKSVEDAARKVLDLYGAKNVHVGKEKAGNPFRIYEDFRATIGGLTGVRFRQMVDGMPHTGTLTIVLDEEGNVLRAMNLLSPYNREVGKKFPKNPNDLVEKIIKKHDPDLQWAPGEQILLGSGDYGMHVTVWVEGEPERYDALVALSSEKFMNLRPQGFDATAETLRGPWVDHPDDTPENVPWRGAKTSLGTTGADGNAPAGALTSTLEGEHIRVIDDAVDPQPRREFADGEERLWTTDDASLPALTTFATLLDLTAYAEGIGYPMEKWETPVDTFVRSKIFTDANMCGARYTPRERRIDLGGFCGSSDPALQRDVVVHEAAHAFQSSIYALATIGEGAAVAEGFADYIAASYTDDPVIAEDFGSGGRDISVAFTAGETTGEPHNDGRVLASALWELRERLGQDRADALALSALTSFPSTFEAFEYGLLAASNPGGDPTVLTQEQMTILSAFMVRQVGPLYSEFKSIPESTLDPIDPSTANTGDPQNLAWQTAGSYINYDYASVGWHDEECNCYYDPYYDQWFCDICSVAHCNSGFEAPYYTTDIKNYVGGGDGNGNASDQFCVFARTTHPTESSGTKPLDSWYGQTGVNGAITELCWIAPNYDCPEMTWGYVRGGPYGCTQGDIPNAEGSNAGQAHMPLGGWSNVGFDICDTTAPYVQPVTTAPNTVVTATATDPNMASGFSPNYPKAGGSSSVTLQRYRCNSSYCFSYSDARYWSWDGMNIAGTLNYTGQTPWTIGQWGSYPFYYSVGYTVTTPSTAGEACNYYTAYSVAMKDRILTTSFGNNYYRGHYSWFIGDPIAPATTATCNSAACSTGWYNTKPVQVKFNATDSCMPARATESMTMKTCSDSVNTCDPYAGATYQTCTTSPCSNPAVAIDVSAEGTTYVRYATFDQRPNYEAAKSQAVKIDTVIPLGPTNFTGTTAYNVTNPTVTYSWSGASDPAPGSGVCEYHAVVQSANDGIWRAASWTTPTGATTVTFPMTGLTSGEKYLMWALAKDCAGNQASAYTGGWTQSFWFIVDTTLPEAPGKMTSPSWAGDHWVKSSFIAKTSGANDPAPAAPYNYASGISYYKLCRSADNATGCTTWVDQNISPAVATGTGYTVSGTHLPSHGTYRYYYWYAVDAAGNQSPASIGEYVRMDSVVPAISGMSASPTSIARGQQVTFYANATDGNSGLNTGNAVFYLATLPYSSWNVVNGGTMTWNSGASRFEYLSPALNYPKGTQFRAWVYIYDIATNQAAYDWNPTTVQITNTPPPISVPITPANGTTVLGNGSSITFTTNAVTDIDGDTVQYYFRIATGTDGETGVVCNSGYQTSTTYSCNPGPGTFYWHVYTYDGYNETSPNYVWSFFNNYIPTNGTVSPSSGWFPAGARTFTTTYSDANGVGDISDVRFLFNSSGIDGNSSAFYGRYLRATNQCFVYGSNGDNGNGGPYTGNQVFNLAPYTLPWLTLNSCAASAAVNTLTVTWNMTFNTWNEGSMNEYLWVIDGEGESPDWSASKGTIGVDVVNPSAPSTPGGVPSGNTITWTTTIPSDAAPSSGINPNGYNWQYRVNGGGWVDWTTTGGTLAPAFTWSCSQLIETQVRAKDNAGNYSGWSSIGSARTDPCIPNNVSATDGTLSQRITVTWGANGNPGTYTYEVHASSDGTNYSLLTTTAAGVTTTTHNGLIIPVNTGGATVTRYYKIRAKDPGGALSAFSTADTGSVLPSPAFTTNTRTGTLNTSKTRVQLAWNAVPNATNYRMWVFDGISYETWLLGNVTSWDSDAANIYPTPAQLAAATPGGGNTFRPTGDGTDMKDDANEIYTKNLGSYGAYHYHYWIHVAAVDSTGIESGNTWSGANANATGANPDRTSPTTPGTPGFSTNPANATVTISWTASTDPATAGGEQYPGSGMASYDVYRNGAFLKNVASATTTDNPADGAYTYYVVAKDAQGNTSQGPTSTTLVMDKTPPAGGSFYINSGNPPYTNNALVTLFVTCPTDTWGPVQYAFGNSANPSTGWTNCSSPVMHTLSAGDGLKTVYMRFRDGGGNTTTVDATDTITLDTTAPTFTIQYYWDSALTSMIPDDTKLGIRTAYVKVTASEALAAAPTVGIDAEGAQNDVANGGTTLVSIGNDYKYTRTIVYDAAAVGTTRELWTASGTDLAGNTATNFPVTNRAAKAMFTDTVAPTITSVTSPTANGAYNAGDIVIVQVVFNEPVFLEDGTPGITLETGATDAVAYFDDWDSPTTMNFAYYVAAGENSPDLEYVSANALQLYGAAIMDNPAENPAVITLPAPGAAGSLGANKAIVIDTVAPTVTINQSGPDPTNANPIFTATFNEAVTGFATGDVTLTGTAGATTGTVTGTGPYTVTASDMTKQGTVDATIAAGVATDAAGNPTQASSSTDNSITYDTVAPTVTITNLAGDTTSPYWDMANDSLTNLVLGYADATSGPGTCKWSTTNVPYASMTNSCSAISGGTSRCSFGALAEGTYSYYYACNDAAGNASTQANINFGVDWTVPTCSIASITEDTAATCQHVSGTTVFYNNNASCASGTGQHTVTVTATDATGIASVAFPTTVQTGVTDTVAPYAQTYTYDSADTFSAAGTVTVTDSAGRTNTCTFTTTRDIAVPTGTTITYTQGYQTTAPIALTVGDGTDALSQVDTASRTVQAQTCAMSLGWMCTPSGAFTTVATSGTYPNLTYSGANNTCYKFQYRVSDNVANAGAYATSANIRCVDTTPPTITSVTSSTDNGTYGPGATISIQVQFSETVNVTGTPQLTLETGASDAVVNYFSGTGSTTLTFDYTVAAGHTSLDLDYASIGALALNGGTIKDNATNNATLTLFAPGTAGSLASNQAIVIDTTPPVVSITSVEGDTAPTYYDTSNNAQTVVVLGVTDLTTPMFCRYHASNVPFGSMSGNCGAVSGGASSCTIPNLTEATYAYYVSCGDSVGNYSTPLQVPFKVDWTHPGTMTCAASTGGTITTSGNYTIHTFTSGGTFTSACARDVEVLVVAGGGGGGGSGGGGGGAGGVRYSAALPVNAQGYAVTVGGGGAGGSLGNRGTNGQNSVFSSLTAAGGGGGGYYSVTNGYDGGSGGGAGAGNSKATGGSASPAGQGNAGGGVPSGYGAGGGGGAGAVGGYATVNDGGTGGAGSQYSISGSATYYAGGGGGGGYGCTTPGGGGQGGGGIGSCLANGTSGTANTGGGGGGGGNGASSMGGSGGSGIVIVRYLTPTLVIPVVSVAGDTTAPYADAVNDGATDLVVNASDAVAGPASCKWSTTNQAFSAMTSTCDAPSGSNVTCHFGNVPEGSYTYYYACNDLAGNSSPTYSVAFTAVDVTPPTVTVTSLAGDTTAPYWDAANDSQTNLILGYVDTGSGPGACKWSTTNTPYASMANTCAAISGGASTCSFGALAQGAYSYYYACNDAYGNASTQTKIDFGVDWTRPTVTNIARQSPAGQYTNATSVTWRVTFSESVSDIATSDFTLVDLSSTLTGESITSVSATSGATVDVTVNTGTGNGTLRLDVLPAATLADAAGNDYDATYTGDQTFSIDKGLPVVTIAEPANGTSSGSPPTMNGTATDDMAGVERVDVQIRCDGSAVNTGAASDCSGTGTVHYWNAATSLWTTTPTTLATTCADCLVTDLAVTWTRGNSPTYAHMLNYETYWYAATPYDFAGNQGTTATHTWTYDPGIVLTIVSTDIPNSFDPGGSAQTWSTTMTVDTRSSAGYELSVNRVSAGLVPLDTAVVTNSGHPSFTATNATNGSTTGTAWSMNAGIGSTIALDLGTATSVNAARIYVDTAEALPCWYRIENSSNGSTWNNTGNMLGTLDTGWNVSTWTGGTAMRYWRLYLMTNCTGSAMNITEIALDNPGPTLTSGSNTIADMPEWSTAVPNSQAFPGDALGFRVNCTATTGGYSGANYNSTWWGDGGDCTTADGANAKYAGFPVTPQKIADNGIYNTSEQTIKVEYRLSIPASQPTGTYEGTITYTVVTTP